MTQAGGGSWRWRTYPLAILVAIVAAVVLVVVSSDGASSLSGRLGGDFPEFYAAGQIVADGDGDRLYEVDRQVEAQARYWGEEGSLILFAYPPVVAATYRVLALLDYRLAYLVHTLAMIAALGAAVLVLRSVLPVLTVHRYRLAAVAFTLTFLPMFTGVTLGQNTALVLLAGSGVWWGLHHHRDLVAGVAMGLLTLKPQYGVPLLALVVLARRWTAVAAAAVTTVVLWLASAAVSGFGWMGPWLDLTRSLSEIDQGANLHNEVSWLGLAEVALGAGSGAALAIALVAGATTVAALVWRLWTRPVLDHLTVALVLPTLLVVAPHSLYYDAGMLVVSVGALITTIPERHQPQVLALWWVAGFGHLGAAMLGVQPVALLVIATWAWAWHATSPTPEVRSRRRRPADVTG
ncbi:MAG: glycosyltransferase family 87 protein [Acidimicrobiales bacterium]|nr:glycosyltransferase family 87 protein [Acidimicrobiales bacterium]